MNPEKLFCDDHFASVPHGPEKAEDGHGRKMKFTPGPGEGCSFCPEPTQATHYADQTGPVPDLTPAADDAPSDDADAGAADGGKTKRKPRK